MAPYKKLDLHQQSMVVAKVLKGNSFRGVAISMGINFKAVAAIIKKQKSNISLADLPCVGRAEKITPREDRLLVRMSLGDQRLMARELKQRLEQHSIQLVIRTVRERLEKTGP